MSVLVNVVIWGVVAGATLGVVLYYAVPGEFHPIVERICLRFGGFGAMFGFVSFAITMSKPGPTQVITALGITVLTFLVAGVWLFIANKRRSGV